MTTQDLAADILALVAADPARGHSPQEITAHLKVSRPTVNRALARLTREGRLLREGAGRSTRYHAPPVASPAHRVAPAPAPPAGALLFSRSALSLRAVLEAPIAARTPVGYRRDFVDGYEPNRSSLLPAAVSERLYAEGRSREQQPAGTYARKVLEQLLIDLSWNSSRLEGNRFSLIDTRELFERGRTESGDPDATMLLNHKEAIEFLVDVVPEQGITGVVIRNLHSVLMQGLLADPASVGATRRRIVNIEGSVYTPTQVPALIEEMLEQIVRKVRLIKNPIEAAFFLWVQIAYLQPFEDGNKRTSRLAANLPLFISNCAPLSFLDVQVQDYAYAMLGIYERTDSRLAAELFEWTYRRSIEKYRVVRESLGAPDPLRARYRDQIGDLVRRVVGGGILACALEAMGLPEADRAAVRDIVRTELDHLQPYNCARFRLNLASVERWIAAGRPGR